jgi:hypothetical protein
MAGRFIVGAMNTLIPKARHMGLALVVAAVVVHGHLQAAYSGAAPGSSGLTRLNRDLMRLTGSGNDAEVAASQGDSSRHRRGRA